LSPACRRDLAGTPTPLRHGRLQRRDRRRAGNRQHRDSVPCLRSSRPEGTALARRRRGRCQRRSRVIGQDIGSSQSCGPKSIASTSCDWFTSRITGENGGDSLSSPNTLDAPPDLGQTRGPVFSSPRAGAPETRAVRPSLVALLEAPQLWHARRLLQLYAIYDAVNELEADKRSRTSCARVVRGTDPGVPFATKGARPVSEILAFLTARRRPVAHRVPAQPMSPIVSLDEATLRRSSPSQGVAGRHDI